MFGFGCKQLEGSSPARKRELSGVATVGSDVLLNLLSRGRGDGSIDGLIDGLIDGSIPDWQSHWTVRLR